MTAVARIDELEPGRLKLVRAGEARLAVVKTDSGVHVVAAACTHARIFLAPGRLTADGLIECPMHGALFSPIDGAVRCAPATVPLAVHEVAIVDGQVLVDPEPLPTAAPAASVPASAWANWT